VHLTEREQVSLALSWSMVGVMAIVGVVYCCRPCYLFLSATADCGPWVRAGSDWGAPEYIARYRCSGQMMSGCIGSLNIDWHTATMTRLDAYFTIDCETILGGLQSRASPRERVADPSPTLVPARAAPGKGRA
jgi:hypothetical protein